MRVRPLPSVPPRRAALGAALLALLFSLSAPPEGRCEDPPKKPSAPEAPRARAERLLREGHVEQAGPAFEEAIKADPTDLEAHRGYQNTLRRLKQSERLLSEYKARLVREPLSPAAHYLYGRLLQGAEFEKELQAAVHLDTGFYLAHLALGQFYLKAGRLEEACAELKAAVEARPEAAEGHNLYAFACLKVDAVEPAELHYRRALKLQPEYADAHFGLGLVLKSTGRYSEAVDQFLPLVQKTPGAWDQHPPLIQCLTATGRYDEARAYRRALVQLYAVTKDPKFKAWTESDIDLIDMGDLFLLVSERLDRQGDAYPVFRFRVLRRADKPDHPIGTVVLQFTRFNSPERVYELLEERATGAGGGPNKILYLTFASEQEYLDLLPRVKEIARSIQGRQDD
ncbi:MAG: tetratricopeptide repeat protein [Planctomycetes bacterium]|nr:tetratricopeptide repeat protein [Planctomycetota bacterium]